MKEKLKTDGLLLVTHIYVFLPVLLFVLLWLKWFIGIPLALLILWGMYENFRDEDSLWKPERNRETIIKLVVILALITMWVLSSGVGASVAQYPDHMVRNTLFQIIVDQPWPVEMTMGNGASRGLTYYIGFWLPAAVIGKIISYRAGLLFMQIWSVLGIFLIWRFICERQKSYSIWFFLVFVFFGGLDALGRWITGEIYNSVGNSHEWWAMFFNYPGMTTHLFWAYNQVIYGWLLYCLLMRQTNNKGLIFIWSTALLSCTFPAVGLIPFVIYRAWINSDGDKLRDRTVQGVKRCLSIRNGTGILIALLMCCYLLPNDALASTLPRVSLVETVSAEETLENEVRVETKMADPEEGSDVEKSEAESPAGKVVVTEKVINDNPFKAYHWTTKLWMYFWFILLEVGLFFFLVYPYGRGKPLFWICLGVLLICPSIKVGYNIDFCERASIPAMLCLYEFVISALRSYKKKKNYLLAGLIVALLLGGSLTTMDTIKGTMAQTAATVENLVDDGQEVVPSMYPIQNIMGPGSNFSTTTDSFFFRVLAK